MAANTDISELRAEFREDLREFREDIRSRLSDHAAESRQRSSSLEASLTSLATETREWQAKTATTIAEATTKLRTAGAVVAIVTGALVSFTLNTAKGCLEPGLASSSPASAHGQGSPPTGAASNVKGNGEGSN